MLSFGRSCMWTVGALLRSGPRQHSLSLAGPGTASRRHALGGRPALVTPLSSASGEAIRSAPGAPYAWRETVQARRRSPSGLVSALVSTGQQGTFSVGDLALI